MYRNATITSNVLRGLLLAVACVVGFLLVRRQWAGASPPSASVPRDTAKSRNEVVFVFIGDINCEVCRSHEFSATLKRVLLGVRGQVAARGDLFRAVGVVITPDFRRGYAYLRRLGTWDEISLGGGWLNALVVQNVWSGESRGTVPQVVVYARTVHRGPGVFLTSNRTRSVTVTGGLALQVIADSQQWARLLPPSPKQSSPARSAID